MRSPRPLLLVFLLLLVSGCAQYVWVKPGGDPTTFGADNYACKENAMQSAPPVFQTFTPYWGGPDWVRTRCVRNDHYEECRSYIAQHGYPSQPRTVDLNAANRSDLFGACMNAKGWILQPAEDGR